jgi:hypothetical protein
MRRRPKRMQSELALLRSSWELRCLFSFGLQEDGGLRRNLSSRLRAKHRLLPVLTSTEGNIPLKD